MIGSLVAMALKVVAVLVVVLALAVLVLVLRVSYGALPLDMLTPVIEDALSASDGSYRVHMRSAELTLADAGTHLVIQTRDLRIDDHNGVARATIPTLSLGLDLGALLHGMIAPTRIVVSAPQLHVERDAQGRFQLGLGGEEGGGDQDVTNALVAELLAPPDPRRASGYLEEISLRDAKLTVDDRLLGSSWTANRAAITLFRNKRGIFGDFALAVDVEQRTAELDGEFRYVALDRQLTMNLSLADWEMAKLQHLVPALAPLGGLRVPIGGTAEFALNVETGELQGARIDLNSGAGSLDDPSLAFGTIPVGGATISASYDPAGARFTLHKLALDLAGPSVSVSGTVDGLGPDWLLRGTPPAGVELTAAIEAQVASMPANDLARFWPLALAHNARTWVTANIRDGIVDETHLATKLRVAATDLNVIGIDAFGGGMRMHGLTVDYKHPLPPVLKVDGSATFDQTHMELFPTSGVLKRQRITGGKIVITDLEKIDQYIDIKLDVTGPLRDALEVIDAKPLQYAHEVGLDPATVDGMADGHLAFKFMLDHRTTMDDVELAVRAQIAGAAIRQVAFQQDLDQGDLQLRLDRGQMQVEGTARLGGVPAAIGWVQYFKARDGVRSRYTARGELDDAARRRFGFELPDNMVTGSVTADATLTSFANKRGDAVVALDLGKAALSVSDLNWSKPAGEPATGRLALDLAGDHLSRVRDATIQGRGVDLRMSAEFNTTDHNLQQVELKKLNLGNTDFTGTVARRPEGGWRANLVGGSLDATVLLDSVTKPGPSRHDEPPLVIDARFGRVLFGPKREARDVVAQLYSDGAHWQSIRLDLAPLGSGALRLRFGETSGSRPFDFSTTDLGATLRLLDVSDHVTGGRLSATGQAQDIGAARVFNGRLDGADYKIVGAPVMAKLLSLASFTSIASLLSGEGIPFTRLTGDFTAQDGKVTVKQGRAYGAALGINASGTVDLGQGALDLEGTLVPAYMLNNILSNIPLIGNFLLGGEGQGLFAAAFRVSGPLDDPSISVNPLSALAPGALRNLFLFEPGSPEGAQAPRREGN
jgi:uncharacterized protein DUF3971/AsmA-like protein